MIWLAILACGDKDPGDSAPPTDSHTGSPTVDSPADSPVDSDPIDSGEIDTPECTLLGPLTRTQAALDVADVDLALDCIGMFTDEAGFELRVGDETYPCSTPDGEGVVTVTCADVLLGSVGHHDATFGEDGPRTSWD
ncbi:MAG: hypothetical protein GY913_28305 [Proteobacteria bacterium]|nr:hypothetical protein [Pseudomonadota bacterium]MCP4920815.1 hypothetical protein [Pseudomonadota bacterium]